MTPVVYLATAVAVAVGLLLVFAIVRRVMRSNHIPVILDSQAVAFGLALALTTMFSASLMFTGFAINALLNSVAAALVGSLAIHLIIWSVARLIVPLTDEKHVVGRSILDPGKGGLAAG